MIIHPRYRRRYSAGFTLIELLVVIAIIAVLAAILFPVFAKAREKARQTQCLNNQRQFVTALMMFAQDHDESMPGMNWQGELSGAYGMTGRIWDCPSTSRKGTESSPDYGYNTTLTDTALGDITAPESRVAIADLRSSVTTGLLSTPRDIDKRHNDGAVVGFVDGHVVWAKTGLMLKSIPAGNPLDVLFWIMADAGVEVTGTSVNAVQDWGPNMADAKAPSTGKPTLVKDSLNGLPILRFDGVNDVLTGTLETTTSTATMVTVLNMPTITDGEGILTVTDGVSAQDHAYAGDFIFQQYNRTGTIGTRLLLNGTSSILGPYGAADFPASTWKIVTIVINGTQAIIYVNGKQLGPTTITRADRLWKYYVVSARCSASTPNGWANNEIAEMLLMKSALTSSEVSAVESYLKSKYGITY